MSRWVKCEHSELKVGDRVKVDCPTFAYRGIVEELRDGMITIDAVGGTRFELLEEDEVLVLR